MTGEKAGDPMFDLAAFSAAVRDCSAALGMSVREAARDSGISPATFNRIQRGKAPDVENYLRIMAWLKLNQWPAPMTAPAAMPSVEDVARIICRRVHEAICPNAEDWRPGELERKVDIFWPHYTREARAILDLFAPILAEKEREIATFDSREAEWNEAIANSLQNEEDAHRKLEDAEAALAAERERCAKIAEDLDGEGPTGSYDNGGTIDGWNMATRRIAAAIRAQGE